MTIITLTKRGTLKLPKDVMQQLGDAKHLQVRLSASCLSLIPVRIQPQADLRAIPTKGR